MAHQSNYPIASFPLCIAISLGWCAVSPLMKESQEEWVSSFIVDDIEGHKAFRTDGFLYIVINGDSAYEDVDRVNERFGEENVSIYSYTDGYILEVKV